MIGILNCGNTPKWENIPLVFADHSNCCTKNQNDLGGRYHRFDGLFFAMRPFIEPGCTNI